MSVLQEAFHVVDQNAFDASRPKLVHLTRKVATELVLLAVLMPLAVSDIAAPLDRKIYCTDASLHKGAILEADVDEKLLRVLYRTSISKGAYTKMLSGRSSVLKSHDWRFEEEPYEEDDVLSPQASAPERPIAFSFEFIEVFAGSSKITKYLEQHGINCGPPLDLSLSSEFDVAQVHVISWLTSLISSKKLRAFVLEPPCTTYSIMRRPRLRSREKPLGFCPREEKTQTGNILSCRGGQLLHVGARHGAFGLLETPYSSYMKHMPFWRSLESYECFKTVRCDSCRYGSPHLKSFRFLCLNIKTDRISSRCICQSRHLQVQGSLTKASAIYTDLLAENIALTFVEALRPSSEIGEPEKTAFGLESLLVNEVMQSCEWKESSVWSFKKQSHINILEEAALYRLVCRIAKKGRSIRSIAITDSNVVKCATAKGRTSSKGLGPILRKLCSLVLAAGIYLNVAYIPTRLNCADDPTRDHPVRGPLFGMDLSTWTSEDLFKLSSLGRFRRWSSNWLRLCILLMGPSFLYLGDRSLYRFPWQSLRKVALPQSLYRHSLEFDASLGFPGEGPFCLIALCACFLCVWLVHGCFVPCLLIWTSFCFACSVPVACHCRVGSLCFPWVAAVLLGGAPAVAAMPVFPTTAGDWTRSRLRNRRPALTVGRPVETMTLKLRERLLEQFGLWIGEQGLDLDTIFSQGIAAADDLNILLCRYGRLLYQSGKTYNSFAETINAVTTRKPALRRSLQGAWDLGYAWVKAEPSQHHVAMPAQIMCAMVGLAITWGWLPMAACLALAWGALLRPGELLGAFRRDLLLPSDLSGTIGFALLSIAEPKSRHTTARHQSAKLDIPDLLTLVDVAFRDYKPNQKLWPHAASTMRSRFNRLLRALKLPCTHQPNLRCLDLGSVRSGGATWLMLMTENSDLCRRRGRWASHRMMEIYVQETMALQYIKVISPDSRKVCLDIYASFSAICKKAFEIKRAKIPESVWYILFTS